MTLKSIDEVVTMLAEAFGQKVTPIRLMAYDAGLSDVPLAALNAVVVRAIRESRFMPTVAELRELCGVVSGRIAVKDRPTLAWLAVREAISKVGAYDSPNFSDPKINAAIRAIGGWVFLCDSTSEELVWREKDFLRNYSALEPLKLDSDQTARLSGITERENGTALPAPIVNVGCLTVGTSSIKRMEKPDANRITGPHIAAEKLAERLAVDDREIDLPAIPPKSKQQQVADLKRLTNGRLTIND